jgi:hypothetical protein
MWWALSVMNQKALLTTYLEPDIHALKRIFRLPSFPCHSTSLKEVISGPQKACDNGNLHALLNGKYPYAIILE